MTLLDTGPSTLPPARTHANLLDGDPALLEGLRRHGGAAHEDEVRALGDQLAKPEWIERGHQANRRVPEHVPYDRGGERVDRVQFDSDWHALMDIAVRTGIAGGAWADDRPGAHVARAAKFLLLAQVEAGITCPLAMTNSCVPALRMDPAVAERWEPLVTSGAYDPRELPASRKNGALIGMALTERAGGSDLSGMTCIAEPEPDGSVRVTGNKWYVSAVQSDAFFVLARTSEGISCVLIPRLDEDGKPNGLVVDRLKDKLGNRSNPTAEVDFRGARGVVVGPRGKGVRAIMAMVGGTRHDCVLGSTAVMRLGTSEAIHWAQHRQAFGRPLIEQPAMRAVLADLALESEAATAGALALAQATERAHAGDADAEAFRRLAAPVLKYWTCKRAPQQVAEALECQGGFGYIEDSRLARAYREAPLMSVWEGSGSIQALDVLRALQRSPASLEAVLDQVTGVTKQLDTVADEIARELWDADEARARAVTGKLARALQASLLVQHAPGFVADAFCASRLGEHAGTFGDLPAHTDTRAIVERAL